MVQPNFPNSKAIGTTVDKSDPWFEDGNIVFSCEGAARFRVHASLMARHSEVFRNLFADAAAQTASDSCVVVEGCPVIELTDGSEDCQNLMLALCGPVTFKARNVDDFLYLSSLLHMATKYCIDWLRNKAIAHLTRFWPHRLQGWIDLKEDWDLHPALVINLARRANVPIVLPLALYRLGHLPTVEALYANLTSSQGPIAPSGYQLSNEDIHNYTRYQERRLLSARSFVQSFLDDFEPDLNCRSSAICRTSFHSIASDVRNQFLDIACPPISFMELAKDCATNGKNRLCSFCRALLLAAVDERIQSLWEELPSWFGLPDWHVLSAGFESEDDM